MREGRLAIDPPRSNLLRRSGSEVSALGRVLREENAAWDLSPRGAGLIAILPPMLAAAVASTNAFAHRIYRYLTIEDSVLEWIQCALLVGIIVGTLRVAQRLRQRERLGWAGLYVLAALGAFLLLGEEISWGQRLFGLETPPELMEINRQGEINFHNIRGVLPILNLCMLATAGYLTVSPLALLFARRAGMRPPDTSLFVPPLVLATSFVVTFGYRLFRLSFENTSGSFAEVSELMLYLGALMYAFLLARRLGRAAQAGRPR